VDGHDDAREDEVADVARRAAMAASARRSLAREAPEGMSPAEVDDAMMNRLGHALERVEAGCANFGGAMLFRGPAAQPVVSLLPDFGGDEARRMLTRVATAVRMQVELLEDSSLGRFVDSVTSTERGALLIRSIGDDLLVVSLSGSPPEVAPAWRAITAERGEIADAAAGLFTAG
jgi:hypothetical protein